MRILVVGFQHETNTFASSKAAYDGFVRGGMFPSIARGEGVIALRDVNIPVSGFIRSMTGPDVRLVPVIWAAATPSAHITTDAFERIAGEILSVAPSQPLDGICLDLHGAMVREHVDDGEGELLQRLRSDARPEPLSDGGGRAGIDENSRQQEFGAFSRGFSTDRQLDPGGQGARCRRCRSSRPPLETLAGRHSPETSGTSL